MRYYYVAVAIIGFSASLAFAAIDRGPYLQPTADMETAVGIAWRTTTASAGTVRYGISDVTEHSASTASGTHHYITLTGLSAGMVYKYQIICGGETTPVYSFRTSSDTDERRCILLSDVHAISSNESVWNNRQAAMMADMLSYDPDIVIITGDLVENGGVVADWELFFTTYKELLATAILMPLYGNHEAYVIPDGIDNFKNAFYLPENAPSGDEELSYYADYGGIRWVMIAYLEEHYDLAWLNTTMANAFIDNRFLIGGKHHPIYLSCAYDDEMADNCAGWKASMLPLLEANGMDIFLNGHRHLHHRSYPLDQDYPVPSPDSDHPYGTGWGGLTTTETENYQDYDGVIHIELQSTYYQKDGAIYQRPHIASVGPESGDDGKTWIGYSTITVVGAVLTYDAYSYSADGAIKKRAIDHFIIDKSGASRISGRITASGSGLAGVKVSLNETQFGITNTSGEYVIPAVINGSYVITPSKNGYVFDPSSRTVSVADADATGIDFSAVSSGGGTITLQNGLDGYLGVQDNQIGRAHV